ncbi:MAG: MBL fold metallo-hydrolase, partial [Thermodesulfobacteriota bacterium]
SPGAADALLFLGALAIEPADRFVTWLAAHPWSAVDASLASPASVLALGCVAAATQLGRVGGRGFVLALAVALLGVGLPDELRPWLDRTLVVRFLDVGQGDATLVSLPGRGGTLLVDAGGLAGSFDPGERVVLPALRRAGVRRVRAVALSHPDFDHYGGIEAVARGVTIDEFWSSGRASDSASFAELMRVLGDGGVRTRTLARGDAPGPPEDGAEVRILNPPPAAHGLSENDASLVVRVAFGATRLLLTGDVEAAAEAALSARRDAVAATVLKVPHHGSRTSSSRALVAASRPALAVALLGWRNRFGFPAPAVRDRYAAFGAAWRETARDGEIVLRSDGQLDAVETCR